MPAATALPLAFQNTMQHYRFDPDTYLNVLQTSCFGIVH